MKRILLSVVVLALCASCSASGRLSVGLWGLSVSYEWVVTPEQPDDGEGAAEADETGG